MEISSGGGKVTLYIQVLLDNKGNVLEMYKKTNITGNAAATIIESEHGKALKIIVSGTFEITMEQAHVRLIQERSQDFLNGFRLSMSEGMG